MSLKIVNAATPTHEAQMKRLGEFMGADEIIYKDHGNKEDYTLVKGNKKLMITASGGKDGGFLSVREVEPI